MNAPRCTVGVACITQQGSTLSVQPDTRKQRGNNLTLLCALCVGSGEAAGKGRDSQRPAAASGGTVPATAATTMASSGVKEELRVAGDPLGERRVGGDTPLQQGMHSDGLSFLAMSMMQVGKQPFSLV